MIGGKIHTNDPNYQKYDSKFNEQFTNNRLLKIGNNKILSFGRFESKFYYGIYSLLGSTWGDLKEYYEIDYKNIKDLKMLTDDSKTDGDLLKTRIITGSFGAVARSLSKSTKYNIKMILGNHEILILPCKNQVVAEEAYHLIISRTKLLESKSNSNLEIKLNEIDQLYKKGILTKKEYELKRKQIIENH